MTDIFDQKVMCRKCDKEMIRSSVVKGGFQLRALKCDKCGELIVHPEDKHALDHYKDLKGKTFQVKLRMVGNSHAISIPKEIVEFMNEVHRDMRKEMEDTVRLCFEDFGKLSVNFMEELPENREIHKNARREKLRW